MRRDWCGHTDVQSSNWAGLSRKPREHQCSAGPGLRCCAGDQLMLLCTGHYLSSSVFPSQKKGKSTETKTSSVLVPTHLRFDLERIWQAKGNAECLWKKYLMKYGGVFLLLPLLPKSVSPSRWLALLEMPLNFQLTTLSHLAILNPAPGCPLRWVLPVLSGSSQATLTNLDREFGSLWTTLFWRERMQLRSIWGFFSFLS